MSNRKYSEEFKKNIVKLYKNGNSVKKISENYNIPKSNIIAWSKKFQEIQINNKENITVKEIIDLKKELQKLIEENSILIDLDDIYGSIAKKLILNKFNGPYSRRAENILKYSEKFNADGVINFCHFGCRQSNGGSMILKDLLDKNNIPSISIDGDGVDRRNGQDGQNKTRLEAFFEMIKDN